MRVSEDIGDGILFFYASENDAEKGSDPLGTGFLMWASDDDPNQTHAYAITADHVIRKSAPLLAIRGTASRYPITLSALEWYSHPAGDDLAACYLGCNPNLGLGPYFAASQLVTFADVGEIEGVGLGEDCVMVGCFAPHSGTERILPVVRFGNVSTLPNEPVHVYERNFDQECFLVEMRSRGGFSGSPVFVFNAADDPVYRHIGKTLGMCCGHMQEWRTLKTGFGQLRIEENSGMAIVIPGWKIHELLYCKHLVSKRNAEEVKRSKR